MLHNPVTLYPDMLGFIDDYASLHGYPPSIREIADATDFKSVGTVSYHLSVLEARKLITQRHRFPRTIVVTDAGKLLIRTRRA